MMRILAFTPLVLCVLAAGFFYYALEVRRERPVSELASALIDQPFPEFELPSLRGEMLDRERLVTGEVALVNVWASWCAPCREEHPYLQKLMEKGVRIVGVNYKDDPADATAWLSRFGDVAEFHVVDADGRLGIDLGVYGAPETYLVDSAGFIRYKRVGIINDHEWQKMLPLYRALVDNSEERNPDEA